MSKKKKLIKLIDIIVIILLFILAQSMTVFIIDYIQGKTLSGLYIEDVFFWYRVYGLERIVFDFFSNLTDFLGRLNIILGYIFGMVCISFYPIVFFMNIYVICIKLIDLTKHRLVKGWYKLFIIFNMLYLTITIKIILVRLSSY